MQFNRYLNFRRLFLQLKNDLFRHYRTWLITLGAITGVLVAIDLLPGVISGTPHIPVETYYSLFLIVGFIFSSSVFIEMHDSQKGLVYLTTPASELERLLSKFLITNIFYILVAFIYLTLLTYILKGINGLLFDYTNGQFNFNWQVVKIYFIVQSIFLFAGSYFKKHAFLKLIFAGFLINIVLSFYLTISSKIIFDNLVGPGINFDNLRLSIGELGEFAKNLYQAARFTFNWLLAPYFWVLTYLRINEKEV
ncbi:MAG: hypothetical protein K9M80_01960 [Candidatus Marinimicrobia bacterium]|nr:hypothetical protein [Candidatus Neomarinimicrobiota bacterium]